MAKPNAQNSSKFQLHDDDLYAQIAAGDEAEFHAKPKSSLIMSLMIEYMRLTLALDAKRRQYQNLFHILGGIWAFLMGILYLGGLVMFIILVCSYIRLPTYIKDYLEQNGIRFNSIEIPGYVLSHVDLYGLHDDSKSYLIEKVSISSTFSDFLNRRAKSVSIKGIQANLDTENLENQPLIKTLSNINKMSKDGTGIRIDSLEVSDAQFTAKGRDFSFPISLALTGLYGRETNMSAFVNISEKNLKIRGPLLIKNSGDAIRWELSIQDGMLAFPNRPQETLEGKISLMTKNFNIQEITANLTMLYERLRKNFDLDLKANKKDFDGTLSMRWTDVTNAILPEERTSITLEFEELSLSPKGDAKTTHPIKLNMTTHYSNDIQADELNATLEGQLSCQEFKTCQYRMEKPSNISMQRIKIPVIEGHLQNKGLLRFTLQPKDKFLEFLFTDGKINFDFETSTFNFRGKQEETDNPITLNLANLKFFGTFNMWEKKSSATLDMKNLNYKSDKYDLKKADILMDNVFATSGNVYFKSPSMQLKENERLKIPFAIEYTRKDNVSNLVMNIEKQSMQVLFSGYLDLISGQIDGRMVIPPVQLQKLKQPLNEASSIIPEEFQKLSGTLAAYGRVSGNLNTNIKGPFYLALSGIDLMTKDLKVFDLNTVLLIQSLDPLTTESEQKISVGLLDSFIPLSNIKLTLKLEERFAQIRNLSAILAGIPIMAEESLVPYQNVGTLVYLHSDDNNLSNAIRAIKFKDWDLSGNLKGSILFPVEIRDMALNVKNAVLQLFNADMTYTGVESKKPELLGSDKGIFVRSGTLTVDTNTDSPEHVKISMVLDTNLKPSNIKKNIRDTFRSNLTDLMTFEKPEINLLDPEIKTQIEYVQERTEAYRIK